MSQRHFLTIILFITANVAQLRSADLQTSPATNAIAIAPEKKLPLNGETFAVQGHTAFLILPAKRGDASTPWVWYAPTLPGLPGAEEKWMFEKFLATGIGIAGIDVGESYGSLAGRTLYSAFYRELTSKRGMSNKPCLLARSRGGLMLYSWACDNAAKVACIAGIYPVCNPASYPGLDKAATVYGLTPVEMNEQLSKYNPIERLAPLAKAHVPIFHIHGDADTVVPLEANSAALAARYKELGGEIQLVVPPGQGHNMWVGFFQSQQLVDFVISHSKN